MHDKSFWQSILDNNGQRPENESLETLTSELLDYLQSSDPLLRDEFGYQLLTHWIISGEYDADTLKGFLDKWLSDLQSNLGETGTDSILTRSFAALMLSILVYYDMKQSWLTDDDYQRLVDAALDYFLQEKDLRDYDSEKGWYHATAHTADVLKFLARNEKSNAETLQRILDAIARKLSTPQKHIYTHGEDDRISLAVLDVVKRGLIASDAYAAWLTTLVASKDKLQAATTLDQANYGAVQNVKYFLRALHITLAKNRQDVKDAGGLEYQIFEHLKTF